MSDRLSQLTSSLEGSDIDAIVLNPGPTLLYLTEHDFTSHERLFLLVIPRVGDPVAVVPALEEANWRHAVPSVTQLFLWDDADGPESAASAALASLADAKTVAIEPLGLRYMEYSHLCHHLQGAEFVSADDLVSALRLYKSADEAAALRGAVEIAEQALETVLADVRVGSREREIASHLSSELLRRGGGGISFGPIVLSGPKSALPHGVPDEREVQAGELLLIDFGTSFRGYHSDITRTFAVGKMPDDRTQSVYEAVREANAAGVAASKPGATMHEVHTTCQAGLHDAKWDEFLKHRTGHGLGVDIHEPPSVMRDSSVKVEEGMVFTIEPGLYLEGWGGVRIEDDLWITSSGAESLTSFPRDLRVVGG